YLLVLRSMLPRAPCSTLFPYTTLFRSVLDPGEIDWPIGEGLLELIKRVVGTHDTDDLHRREMARARGEEVGGAAEDVEDRRYRGDRKSTRLNSSHVKISYAVFCLKKKK